MDGGAKQLAAEMSAKDEAIKIADKVTSSKSPAKAVENGVTSAAAKCATCNVPLTITPLGNFYPCGHNKSLPVVEKADEHIVEKATERLTVTVTWGEEKFTPEPYSTFSVGPFSTTVETRPGESRQAAMRRAYGELELMAADITQRKAKAFVAALHKVKRESGGE